MKCITKHDMPGYFQLRVIFGSQFGLQQQWLEQRQGGSELKLGPPHLEFNICNICNICNTCADAGADAWLDAQPSALRSPQGSSTPPPPDPPDMPGINRAGLLSLR